MTPLDWLFTIVPISIVLIFGFWKPAFATRYKKKMDAWLHQKKETHQTFKKELPWWKSALYPIYAIFHWLSGITGKFIKSEHWATAVYYGLALLLAGFLIIILFAVLYAALIIAGALLVLWIIFKVLVEMVGEGKSQETVYEEKPSNPFMDSDSKRAYERESFGHGKQFHDDQGGSRYTKESLSGDKYIVDSDGKNWRYGEDMGGGEFLTDDQGKKWYKTEDLVGTEYWKDYETGETIRVKETFTGDKEYIKD